MSEKNSRPAGKVNFIVIGVIVIAAAALILLSGVLSNEREAPTQDDIQQQIAQLQTAAPAPETETAAPETASAEAETEAQHGAVAEAYLFIILNNRVWAIEPLCEERDVTVDQGDGVVNVIHLLPDGFYMASSTCDNQLCVSEGTVTVDNYQRRILGTSVLCLPHNLDLELVVPSQTPDPNAPDI